MAKFIFDSWEDANEAVQILSESKEFIEEKKEVAESLKRKAWEVAALFWGIIGFLFVLSLVLMAFPQNDSQPGIIGKLLTGLLVIVISIMGIAIPVCWIFGFIRLHKEVITPLGGWTELKIFWPGYTSSGLVASLGNKTATFSAYWIGRLIGDPGTALVLGYLWKPFVFIPLTWLRIIFPPFLIEGYIGRREKQIFDCNKFIQKAQKEMALYEQAGLND